MKATVTKTAKKAPKPTSDRKRPNKSFIKQMAEWRGHMTCNEKTMLVGLEVKNLLQRINNRAHDEKIKAGECTELQKLMKTFVKEANALLEKK